MTPAETERYAREFEAGGVLVLPRLAFDMTRDEMRFLDVRWSDGKAKNISLEAGAIKGAKGDASDLAALAHMVARFATDAGALVAALFPRYAPHLQRARTSYRPHPAAGRAVSWRKDDTRLHVDAFPSRPNRGERILRVFCNVNPRGDDRVWRVGETFESMARRLLPRMRADVSRRSADAGGAARHQGTAQRIRPPDARTARSREGRRCIPGQLRAARSPLRARHDMDLLFRSGDARGDVGSIHARADDAPAAVGAVRAARSPIGDPRADHRALRLACSA